MENYGSYIPTFALFQELMDQVTNDYTAIYIHNRTQSNKIEDCVFGIKQNSMKTLNLEVKNFKIFIMSIITLNIKTLSLCDC